MAADFFHIVQANWDETDKVLVRWPQRRPTVAVGWIEQKTSRKQQNRTASDFGA